jgi:hypothetical protein
LGIAPVAFAVAVVSCGNAAIGGISGDGCTAADLDAFLALVSAAVVFEVFLSAVAAFGDSLVAPVEVSAKV